MHQSKLTGVMWPRAEAQDNAQKVRARKEKESEKEKEKEKQRQRENLNIPRLTRSTEADTPPLNRKDIEELPDQEITSTEGGMSYLDSTLLTVPGVPFTAETLVGALFQISMLPGIKGSWTNTNAVRSVAYILAGLDMDEKAAAIAEVVADQLTDRMREAESRAAAAVQEAQDQL